MAGQWDVSYSRMADAVQQARQEMRQGQLPPPPPFVPSAPPPITPGPKPPLTIYPQAGPFEQMQDRALRERGLSPEVFALARRTPARLEPEEGMPGKAIGLYTPYDNTIRVAYGAGRDMSGPEARNTFAHELRHTYQSMNDDPTQVGLYTDSPVNNQFVADATKWAGSQEPHSQYVADKLAHQQRYYDGVSPHETDAYISMNPDITPEQMPGYMQPYYQGWWNPGAQPDPAATRGQGWRGGPATTWEDGSVSRDPLPRGEYRPRPQMQGPQPFTVQGTSNWLEDALNAWRQNAGPDASGMWG